eukprot:CAMPEP_0202965166 /NCGR_PEP_ID=MMETSP1396-20130829/9236_1 /ASSEMBLY_ACC=CAM_ASM_000872 /TAXON_ID= /ORGANISM="Pseudokeronopsis sp., Strain Brazil" /LENGTH=73 /DNA_ID=CAMNT_0049687799 /DNA_START=392 /DNA_END=613 /DNA_ORIENTATION=-
MIDFRHVLMNVKDIIPRLAGGKAVNQIDTSGIYEEEKDNKMGINDTRYKLGETSLEQPDISIAYIAGTIEIEE